MATFRADKFLDAASSGITVDGVKIQDSLLRTRFSWMMSSNTTQSITTGSIHTVQYNTTEWDTYPGGITDLSNEEVVAPVTGKYYCTFNTLIDDSGIVMKCYYYVNGTIVRNDFFTSYRTSYLWGSYNVILEATAGDNIYVGIRAYVAGVVIGSTFSDKLTRFGGYFIGT